MGKTPKILLLISIVFLILSGFFFYKGYDVKTNYYNSEKYTSLNQNAYVGGDAYNYIINGTYFTGYMVIGSAFFISSIILGCTQVCLAEFSKPIIIQNQISEKQEVQTNVIN